MSAASQHGPEDTECRTRILAAASKVSASEALPVASEASEQRQRLCRRLSLRSCEQRTCAPNKSSHGWRLRRAHSEACPCSRLVARAISPHVTSAPSFLQTRLHGHHACCHPQNAVPAHQGIVRLTAQGSLSGACATAEGACCCGRQASELGLPSRASLPAKRDGQGGHLKGRLPTVVRGARYSFSLKSSRGFSSGLSRVSLCTSAGKAAAPGCPFWATIPPCSCPCTSDGAACMACGSILACCAGRIGASVWLLSGQVALLPLAAAILSRQAWQPFLVALTAGAVVPGAAHAMPLLAAAAAPALPSSFCLFKTGSAAASPAACCVQGPSAAPAAILPVASSSAGACPEHFPCC